jgi:nucleotide-binding universal stress UspA family protein
MPPTTGTIASLPIVVGVEGSEPGLAATRWAANEAHLRQLPLWVVHAYPPPSAWSPTGHRHPDADAILALALEVARDAAARVTVTGQEHTSPPARLLIDLSAHASLVVVGHRGQGCGSALRDLRSPVASAVAAHARGPVAVVRPSAHPAVDTGPVVVGVDGSTAAAMALGLAFEEAALHSVPLEVVCALPPGHSALDPADLDTAQQALHQWVRPWHEAYPRLRVTLLVAPAHPIAVLTQASQRASLLVVGARGGGFARLPVGSVSQQLVHLAACPVLIVRSPAARQAPKVPATAGTATLIDPRSNEGGSWDATAGTAPRHRRTALPARARAGPSGSGSTRRQW